MYFTVRNTIEVLAGRPVTSIELNICFSSRHEDLQPALWDSLLETAGAADESSGENECACEKQCLNRNWTNRRAQFCLHSVIALQTNISGVSSNQLPLLAHFRIPSSHSSLCSSSLISAEQMFHRALDGIMVAFLTNQKKEHTGFFFFFGD